MWTSKNRGRYDRSKLRYPSDLTDDEWRLVEPLIPPGRRGGGKRTVQGAEVILAACATVNAIIRRENLKEVDGALILDCNAVLLKTTEAMAELSHSIGLRASQRLLYQSPQRSARDEWMRIYNYRHEPQLKT